MALLLFVGGTAPIAHQRARPQPAHDTPYKIRVEPSPQNKHGGPQAAMSGLRLLGPAHHYEDQTAKA
jgi:hypothetical protein